MKSCYVGQERQRRRRDLTGGASANSEVAAGGIAAFARIRLARVHTSLKGCKFHNHASLRELF